MDKHKLLLVDDDPFILEGIGEDLERNGYHVTRASNGETAVVCGEQSRQGSGVQDQDLVLLELARIQVLMFIAIYQK